MNETEIKLAGRLHQADLEKIADEIEERAARLRDEAHALDAKAGAIRQQARKLGDTFADMVS